MKMEAKNPVSAGREVIARMAESDGEARFAREVRAGCWDHRHDVSREIEKAKGKI